MKTKNLLFLLAFLGFLSLSCQKENLVEPTQSIITDNGGSGGNEVFHRIRMTIVQNFDDESVILVDSVITSSLPNVTPSLRDFSTLSGSSSFDVYYYFTWQNNTDPKAATYQLNTSTNSLPFYFVGLEKPTSNTPSSGSLQSWSQNVSGLQPNTEYRFRLTYAGLQGDE